MKNKNGENVMDYKLNTKHVKDFLKSKEFTRLSANQQKHADNILSRFNHYMEIDHQLDDQHWNGEAVAQNMVSEFIATREVDNKFGVAAPAVLNAYVKFLKLSNEQEILVTLNKRENIFRMQRSRLLGMNIDDFSTMVDQMIADDEWGPLERETREWVEALEKKDYFQKIPMDDSSKAVAINIFVEYVVDWSSTNVNNWPTNAIQFVVSYSLLLHPELDDRDLKYIVPVIKALFQYLFEIEQIDARHLETYNQALDQLAPFVVAMLKYTFADREVMILANYVKSNHSQQQTPEQIDAWIATHPQEVDSMLIRLEPWRNDDTYDIQEDLEGEFSIIDVVERRDAREQQDKFNKQHKGNVIPFSQKKRNKKKKNKRKK